MANASVPFCSVTFKSTGFDLSPYINSFKFSQSVERVDMLTLICYDVDTTLIEREEMKEGAILEFIWGFKGEGISEKHTCKISSLEPHYSRELTFTIKACDYGIDMKKSSKNKTYENMKTSDIVSAIAAEYNLEADIEPTSLTHKLMAQGNRSDYDFIRYLVEREEDGDFLFYTRGKKLIFRKIQLDSASVRTFTYRDPAGGMLSFRQQSNEVQKEMAAETAQIVSQNPFEGVTLNMKVDESNVKNDKKLGEKVYVYNQNSESRGTRSTQPKETSLPNAANPISESSGRNLFQPAETQKIAENIAHSIKKRAQLHDLTASLEAIGDPYLIPDTIITMAGVAKNHLGNYYCHEVTHDVRPKDTYRVSMSLWKNAAKESGTNIDVSPVASVNKSVGAEKQAEPVKKVEVFTYDDRGERVL